MAYSLKDAEPGNATAWALLTLVLRAMGAVPACAELRRRNTEARLDCYLECVPWLCCASPHLRQKLSASGASLHVNSCHGIALQCSLQQ